MKRAAVVRYHSSGGGGNNVAIANSVATASTNGGNTTLTSGSINSTTGNLFIVAVVGGYDNKIHTFTASDNKGNTYTQLGLYYNDNDSMICQIFYCANGTGGTGHTFTGTADDGNIQYLSIAALEISGSNGFDGSPVYQAQSGNSLSSGNLTTTNANDMVIGVCDFDSSVAQSGSATTLTYINGVPNNGSTCYGLVMSQQKYTSPTTVAAQFSTNPNGTYGITVAFAVKST